MKLKKIIQKFITCLSLYFFCTLSIASTQDNYNQSVTEIITKLMRGHQIPGAAVAIVDHKKTYFYVFGVANKTSNISVTKKTIFEVGSITKLFTALLFTVTANNKNQLDEPLTKYYLELNKNTYMQKITLEELFTHTSGLPFNLPENITTIDQVQNYLLNWQSINTIGTEWQYSNVGIGLVGLVLQNKTHETINQLYKKYILKPLNMVPIGIDVDKKFQPYFAHGYVENGDAVPHSSQGLFPAAWGLKASIQDMSHFLALAIGLPNVPENFRQAMQATQMPRLEVGNVQQGLVWQIHSLPDESLFNEPEKMNLGPLPVKWLSKEQQIFNANKLIDKTGATEGFRAYVAVIPSKQLGIVILLNKYISNGAIVNAGRRIILEQT